MQEQQPTFIEDIEPYDPRVDAYDAVPRDGPAIFVARSNDQGEPDQPIDGRWVDLRLGESALQAELAGHPSVAGWFVLDQLDCGPEMIPEQPTPDELRALIAWAQVGAAR
jgi:hypothetical protein